MAQQANVQAVGALCHYSVFSKAGRMGSPLSTAWGRGSLGIELSKLGWGGGGGMSRPYLETLFCKGQI